MAYNPNGLWVSKDNPNLPQRARTVSKQPEIHEDSPASAQPQPGAAAPVSQISVPEIKPLGSPLTQPSKSPLKSSAGSGGSSNSFFRRFGIPILIGLVVVIGGVAAAMYFLRPATPPSASLSINLPAAIAVGAPFDISISARNTSNVPIAAAKLTLQLPAGVFLIGQPTSTASMDYSLGSIATGTAATQTSTLIVTGNPGILQNINAELVYSAPSSTAAYKIDSASSFSAGASVISLDYSAPPSIVSGQSFPVTLTYRNSSAAPVNDVKITMAYPPAYSFITSTVPAATGASNEWDLGTLLPSQGGNVAITGILNGPTQTQYQFNGTVSTNIGGQWYPVNVQPVNFTLVPPPLGLSLSVNGSPSYISSAADGLTYTLSYANNSNVTFTSVNISAALSGSMYDFTTMQTSGVFNSKSNVITWYAANTPQLASIAPGQSGKVTFSVKTKAAFPIKTISDKNYALTVNGTIQSPVVLTGVAATGTVSTTSLQTKLAGSIQATAQGFWKSGPYPPKVNEATQYTINWIIKNYSTDAGNVKLSAYLQSGTTIVGTPSSTVSSTPAYDPTTGLLTWTIPFIPADAGVVGAPVQASFVVENTPAVTQVGTDVTLLGATNLSATDLFTNENLTMSTQPVTTAIPDDKAHSKGIHSVTN